MDPRRHSLTRPPGWRVQSGIYWLLVGAMALEVVGCTRVTPPRPLVLATTTSVAHSGLLDALLAAFEPQHGITVRTHQVGSGLALKMLRDGHADVVISHAPRTEQAALHEHGTWQYRKIMFNDFLLVGPVTDPAHARGAPSVEEAMRRIARSTERFLSRGDQSGTHEREERLWRAAGAKPEGNRLVVAGGGMATTLKIAGSERAYTLTDRATFARQAGTLPLLVIFEGGPDLLNAYAVVVDPSGANAASARVFADWLADGGGRKVIDGFRIGADRVFHVWPAQSPRDSPGDVPDSTEHS